MSLKFLYGGGAGGGEGGQLNSSMKNLWDNDYMPIKRDPLYIVVPMTVMYSVIFVTGIIGNSITCMVIAKHKYMHTTTNYYLFSLAMSDLILLVSGLPQEMWSIWSRYPYVFGEIFCQLRGLLAEMSANATVLTITAFTAERYVAICHPFMAQSMSKLSRAVKLIVIIWLVAALFAIPQAMQFTVSSLDGSSDLIQCNIRTIFLWKTNIELSTVSFMMSTLLFFVFPMTFITVLYALIGLRLRRTDKLKRTMTVRSSNGEKKISSPEYRANSSSKVLKMLVAVVVAFFICWAPFHAQRLIAIFGSSHASSGNVAKEDLPFLHQLYGISTYVSGVLYYLSTTINPILYHIMSLKFRNAFKATALRCCRGGQDGDGLSGGYVSGSGDRRGRGRHHRASDGSLRRGFCSSSAAAGDRRQMYRRVSGRTTSSSVEFVAPAVHRATAPAAGLTDCWRRALLGRSTVGDDDDDGGGGCNGIASGVGGRRNDEDCGGGVAALYTGRGPTAVRAADERDRRGGSAGQLPETLSSNWTVVSNSSLKDVDGGDLRDELVGYDVVTGADRVHTAAGDVVVVVVVDDDDRRRRCY